MNEYRSVLERAGSNFAPLDLELESILRRRDRKRRNQRIGAGVVGIAVFVAAVWIVTSAGSLDRTQTPAVPGSETGPAETAPPPAPAPAAPDLVRQEMCSDGAIVRLELTDTGIGGLIVRFEVHRSPVGHEWRIQFRHMRGGCCDDATPLFITDFRGTRVASDSGVFVVQLWYPDLVDVGRVHGEAVDTQTGQVCRLGTH